MSVVEPGPVATSLFDRAKNIILTPTAEWEKIDAEQATIPAIYAGYVAPLAAIPVVASVIGGLVFGYGGFGIVFRPDPLTLVIGGVVQYVLILAGVFLMGLVINQLAETFGGKKDQLQAFKVAAYSATAGWLAGIFWILPQAQMLGILGLYSLFLLYRGLPILMKAPKERAVGYAATVIVVLIVLGVVFGVLTTCVGGIGRMAALGGGYAGMHQGARVEGKVALPGGGSLDVGQMQQAAKQLEAQSQAMANGASAPIQAVPTDALKALLPDALPGGFARTEVSTGSGGVAGYAGTTAEGKYARGDSTLTLSVVDMGAAGALASMASALGVQSSTETANGYQKAATIDGRFTTEEVDRAGKTASYTVIAARRFAVSATGAGVTADDVKGAVAAIGIARVEALAPATPG